MAEGSKKVTKPSDEVSEIVIVRAEHQTVVIIAGSVDLRVVCNRIVPLTVMKSLIQKTSSLSDSGEG